jgi:hypothetical protein
MRVKKDEFVRRGCNFFKTSLSLFALKEIIACYDEADAEKKEILFCPCFLEGENPKRAITTNSQKMEKGKKEWFESTLGFLFFFLML